MKNKDKEEDLFLILKYGSTMRIHNALRNPRIQLPPGEATMMQNFFNRKSLLDRLAKELYNT